MTAPTPGAWMRLASGEREYGRWHVSRGQTSTATYGSGPRPRVTHRLRTRCGRYLEVDQAEAWSPADGRPRRYHFVISDEALPSPACRACAGLSDVEHVLPWY